MQTGKELWHYAGQEPLSFIGNTAQHLWVFSGNGQVLLFDIQTGHILASIGQAHWRSNESASTAAMHSVIGGCALDKTKLIALGDTFYQEMSAKTFKFKNRDLSEEFGKYEITCMYPYFGKKYIYFYDSNWISGNPRGKIAALDKKTLKIVWCWDMLKEIGTAPLHLEIIDNHLYVLDNGLTLHVFEEVS
jgi:outer membrane protein assembly factor BamB